MRKLTENLEMGDLARLVHTELHIDEFRSKLGDDSDVIVLSFKVNSKEPANDLVAFIERGYEWVLDADISSGEMDDGAYIVFVEMDRNKQAPENIMTMMEEIMNLTDQKIADWRVRYYNSRKERRLSLEALQELLPVDREEYERLYGQKNIDELKTAAGLPVDSRAPKNEFTESLRTAAGLPH